MAVLDPSIALGVRTPQFQSAADTFGKMQALQGGMQRQQLNAAQIKQTELENQKLEAATQEQERTRQAYVEAQGDPDGFEKRAIELGVGPEMLLKIRKGNLDQKNTEAQIKAHDLPVTLQQNDQMLGLFAFARNLPDDQYQQQSEAILAQARKIDPKFELKALPPKADLEVAGLHYSSQSQRLKQADEARKVVEAAQKAAKEGRDIREFDTTLPGKAAAAKLSELTAAGKAPIQPAQQATIDQAARPNTPAEFAAIAADPSKPPQERAAANAALKAMEKHALASRPVTNVFNPPASNGQQGPTTLDQVPEKFKGDVQAITEYRRPMPAMGRNNPYSQELSYWIGKVAPEYDGTQFATRNKTQAAYGAGGKEGQNITSINTAIGHLGSLYEGAEKLDNTAFRGYNTFANWASKQSGKDTVKPFELARIAVSEELGRAFKGGVATQGEVEQWDKAINQADSPQQLRTSIKTITELLASRVHAQEDAYTDSMGRKPRSPFVREKSQKVLDKISGTGGASGPATHRFNPATGKIEAVR